MIKLVLFLDDPFAIWLASHSSARTSVLHSIPDAIRLPVRSEANFHANINFHAKATGIVTIATTWTPSRAHWLLMLGWENAFQSQPQLRSLVARTMRNGRANYTF